MQFISKRFTANLNSKNGFNTGLPVTVLDVLRLVSLRAFINLCSGCGRRFFKLPPNMFLASKASRS